ncbi:MAG TPA: 4-alpha-glucanotransferase [Chloroflexota bacterium]|jgi:4-alpha-glucanotransferase|nr:4-alpha-glucanotransferase [Chloroflexota bacterium]
MRFPRSSGVLLHPTSLPGPDGIGDLGSAADRFVDFLARSRQTLWQILPLGPTGPDNSPYAASSAFAGNPLLISLERLADQRLGPGSSRRERTAGTSVAYDRVRTEKTARLQRAWEAFAASPARLSRLEAFGAENPWLRDYVLFAAIKEAHGGASWTAWPAELAHRQPAALRRFHEQHRGALGFHGFLQLVFAEQWAALKEHARARGVRLMGDVPIFVAHDSADVWAHPELFRLDERGRPTEVAGVPPDYFSATGQLWGNPLYRWDALAADGFRWWIERFRRLFAQVDLARVDHFRGFVAHWVVPATETTAVKGHWETAPGVELFRAVEAALGPASSAAARGPAASGERDGGLPLVAEDLGTITPDVHAVRRELGYPGMRVLHFAFEGDAGNLYLPHMHERHSVVYTGTHDNDTTVGWYAALDEPTRHRVRHYLGVSGHDIAWDLIRAALMSVADTAILPLQDVLGLGSAARMNVPGTAHGNWTWRYAPDALTDWVADRLGSLTCAFGRELWPGRPW